jgi:hypothetical protein
MIIVLGLNGGVPLLGHAHELLPLGGRQLFRLDQLLIGRR